MVTAVLNGFRRHDNLVEQVEALRGQSVPVDEVLVWYNNPGDGSHVGRDLGVDTVFSTRNFGVWSRFFFALNAKNPFVVVFDDDTIPGSRWVENCLGTMESHEGLLGTVGLVKPHPEPPELSTYWGNNRVGWVNPNEGVTEVDFVGHSWFFRREWLEFFVRDLPDLDRYSICGEDMHFSFMLQKYAGIKTFVPPHPTSDRSLWGSLKGNKYGTDQNSLFVSNPSSHGSDFRGLMDEFFRLQRLRGWRLVNEK